MLVVHVPMGGKGRKVAFHGSTQGGDGRIADTNYSNKKERSFVRHSYHPQQQGQQQQGQQQQGQQQQQQHNQQKQQQNSNCHNGERRGLTRERSFMRPQSSYMVQDRKGGLQRERSFMRNGSCNNNNNYNDAEQNREGGTRRRGAMPASNRAKPAMEIYRPPTLRTPGIFDGGNGEVVSFNGKNNSHHNHNSHNQNHHNQHQQNGSSNDYKTNLNVNAKEFVSSRQTLQHSKSSSSVPFQTRSGSGLQHSKSGGNLRHAPHQEGTTTTHAPTITTTTTSTSSNNLVDQGSGSSPPPARVHFGEPKENDLDHKETSSGRVTSPCSPLLSVASLTQAGIKRSKSLNAADMRHSVLLGDSSASLTTMPDLGPFSPDIQNSLNKTLADPNSVSARQLMEAVRHIFTRLVEASRHAEPAARLCIAIVQKEKGETFLETLLNTCQEYFRERDRLLRNNPPAPYPGFVPAHPRWIAYMTFLNEMYTQLKRRHVQLMTKRMRNCETAPGLLLLTLLAQCCQVCLREPAVNSLAETECLFFVLTGVGKDIEVELPQQMGRVMTAARDAFLTSVRVAAVRKTLLQLIELHAARWQLPAPAVMYYYPGSGAK